MQKVFSTFQTYLHSIKHSPWPPSLTSPGQAIGVCQSTFRMWFIIADITIHIMALWSFHNDGPGSALITLKDCRGRSPCDRSCRPSLYPCSVTWSKTTVSMRHQCETRSDVNTRFIGSSRAACANKLEDPRLNSQLRFSTSVMLEMYVTVWNVEMNGKMQSPQVPDV